MDENKANIIGRWVWVTRQCNAEHVPNQVLAWTSTAQLPSTRWMVAVRIYRPCW